MSTKENFLMEMKRETANTRKMIGNLTEESLGWKPHEKSMTTGRLAGHIVELHNWVSAALEGDSYDVITSYKPFKPTSLKDLTDALDNTYAKNVEMVNALSDEEWKSMWSMTAGTHVIATMPKIAAFRYMIHNHLIHHRGQLSVYLRMQNIPVPGIYGPSADEQ